MNKISFVDLQAQYHAYQADIDAAIARVVNQADFIMGHDVKVLEEQLQKFTGAKHCVTCANGTDALMLALMAIDIQPDEEVITPSFTYIATAEAAALLKAKVVLVDIQEDTYNLDPNQLAAAITPKTRVIMPVSLYGQVADMDEIKQIAEEYSKKFGKKIYVIEDAAQSLGAEYKGIKSCNLSDIACASFFPSKPLGCYGDGGALFTNDDQLAEKLKSLRAHGQRGRYNHELLGMNSRLDTLQAAILNAKLGYFSEEVKKRYALGAQYTKLLEFVDCVTPFIKPDRTCVYAQYTIRVQNRSAVIASLAAKGIPTAVHYPMPIHSQKCFKFLGYADANFPVSSSISKEVLSLPISPFLTQEQLETIVTSLSESLE